jgi:hypothetical protein
MRALRYGLAAALALVAGGCTTHPDPPVSFIVGLRVLAVVADPPQVAPGATSQLSILAVDTDGQPISAQWSRCTLAPRTGEAVNPGCVTGTSALVPIGSGLSIPFEMPQVTAADLGAPDASNGVYVPLVAQVTAGAQAVMVVYRLRLADGQPPNMNPEIASIDVIGAGGASTPIDPATPFPVTAGEQLTLSATLAPGSAQTYTAVDGTTRTETITVSWFSTAGAFSVQKTGASQPNTVLDLSKDPPTAAGNIDLFAVAHDERGGVGYTHVVLELH